MRFVPYLSTAFYSKKNVLINDGTISLVWELYSYLRCCFIWLLVNNNKHSSIEIWMRCAIRELNVNKKILIFYSFMYKTK